MAFSKRDTSAELNGLFNATVIQSMLDGKGYQKVKSVFHFVAVFIDQTTGFAKKPLMAIVHSKYSSITKKIMNREKYNRFNASRLSSIEKQVAESRRLSVKAFQEDCDNGLFSPKCHLLDHVSGDIEKFWSMKMLDASPFE